MELEILINFIGMGYVDFSSFQKREVLGGWFFEKCLKFQVFKRFEAFNCPEKSFLR